MLDAMIKSSAGSFEFDQVLGLNKTEVVNDVVKPSLYLFVVDHLKYRARLFKSQLTLIHFSSRS